ncbi:MAG: hypothetical protein U5K28_06845 [Halobacteriales archaeon]|nr:hypothetical protein [Halobacteriales archaeon]
MTDDPNSDAASERGGRDIAVPMEIYKSITVFSTLFAVAFVLLAFVMFDAATLGRSFVRELVQDAFGAIGLGVGGQSLTIAFALIGFAFLITGSGIYILGSRFRAEEMGNAKNDADEE